MLIAQATDIHIGFDRGNPDEANMQRFRSVLDRLVNGPHHPDALLLTGDLTEWGDEDSFARLADAVRDLPFPVYPIAGNHDKREALLKAFPNTPSYCGFVQYAVEINGIRVLMLDTSEPDRHSAAFCEQRTEWLARELADHPTTPSLIVMHHPPIVCGIDWMDPNPDAEWIARFSSAIAGHNQIIGIVAGHLHRAIHARIGGQNVSVCPSTSAPVALNLNPVDPQNPDGRDLISDELPGYGLHRWDGNSLVSHYEFVGRLDCLARYDAKLQPMIKGIMAERA